MNHTWSDKAFKVIVVNQTLPSLHGGSLEFILTVPLIFRIWKWIVSPMIMITGGLLLSGRKEASVPVLTVIIILTGEKMIKFSTISYIDFPQHLWRVYPQIFIRATYFIIMCFEGLFILFKTKMLTIIKSIKKVLQPQFQPQEVGIKLTIFKALCQAQGVCNRREIQLTRPALPYDYTKYTCFADGTSFV